MPEADLAALRTRLADARTLPEAADLVVRAARRIAGADGAAFALRDGDASAFLAEDSDRPLWKGQRFPSGICLAGSAISSREAVLVADTHDDPRIFYNIYRDTFVRRAAVIPVRPEDPIGALATYWRVPGSPPASIVASLELVAALAATTMSRLLEPRPTPTLAGRPLPANQHFCAFFRGPSDQYGTLLPFIAEGLCAGEKAVHVVMRGRQDDHCERLRRHGIDVERALSSGQLELLDWERTYLSGGRFEMQKMPAMIEGLIARSREEGYPRLRYVGNMEWCLESCPGVDDVIEYEARLHPILRKYGDPVVCAYDITRYTADFVVDVLRVHQQALVCGILHENPYFVAPEAYVEERRQRAR